MAENSGGVQTRSCHWKCVQCGFALPELPQNAQLPFCPQCKAEQKQKTRCVKCAPVLYSPDCDKCQAPQKPTPVPPEVKVIEPQGNPNTSDEGKEKLEAYQPPELHTSEEETSPPHRQSPPGEPIQAVLPPIIQAIELPSPQPENCHQESGSIEQQPSPGVAIGDKTPQPSPPSSPSSTENDKTSSASLLQKDSDKQPLTKVVEPCSAVNIDSECSPTEENNKGEGPSKAALVTGQRDAESKGSDSSVPNLGYGKVFGSGEHDKSAKENEGATFNTDINENERRQQGEGQEQQKEQNQMEEVDKEQIKEATKNIQDNKVIQSSP